MVYCAILLAYRVAWAKKSACFGVVFALQPRGTISAYNMCRFCLAICRDRNLAIAPSFPARLTLSGAAFSFFLSPESLAAPTKHTFSKDTPSARSLDASFGHCLPKAELDQFVLQAFSANIDFELFSVSILSFFFSAFIQIGRAHV